MDYNLDYYKILNIEKTANNKDIKKSYYALSKKHHPDKGGDESLFHKICDAYKILTDKNSREEYDNMSKYGLNYNEDNELLNYSLSNESDIYNITKSSFDKKKEDLKLNIVIFLTDDEFNNFNGILKYNRYIRCKSCDGCGKDTKNKLVITNTDPNSDFYGKTKVFETDEGCDFCEGTGKDWNDKTCLFCKGKGKIGISDCETCGGEGRVLIEQILKNVSLSGDKTKMKGFGNLSKIENIYGDLLIINK